MIIKNTIYPKTKRIEKKENSIQITEKIDGSNLCFFKYNEELYIAQRNNIFKLKDFTENRDFFKNILYKGLSVFLKEHGKDIEENLYSESAICGEWLGMGRIKYNNRFNNRYLLFAKARVKVKNDNFYLDDFVYDLNLIHFAMGEKIPDYMDLVPSVAVLQEYPTIEKLNTIYEDYVKKSITDVEGFIINDKNILRKYVRFKNGILEEHKF